MKILVFSDSHGDVASMKKAIALESPQHIFHLGDCVRDANGLKPLGIPMTQVQGNCDWSASLPEILTPTLEGTRFYLTHGHLQGVKSGYLRAIYSAMEAQAQVLLFGHTHRAVCFQEQNLWIMNPGAASSTYGIITLDKGAVECQVKSVT